MATEWRDGTIAFVHHQVIQQNADDRGWLAELWRRDELWALPVSNPVRPEMSYVSMTKPMVMRGPHEHRHQTDVFVFFGHFEIFLWDGRKTSTTTGLRQKIVTKPDRYERVIVPPGVIHGYRNAGRTPGLTLNFPDRLYKGWHRSDTVDEIRHEDQADNEYVPW